MLKFKRKFAIEYKDALKDQATWKMQHKFFIYFYIVYKQTKNF